MATWPTVTDDDGSGTTGTILDQALFNSVRDYIGAAWTDVTYSSGNFTASGSMTWTVGSGDQACYRWVEVGKTMVVALFLNATSVGGSTDAELRVAVPNSRTIGTTGHSYAGCGVVSALDDGTHIASEYVASPGNTYVSLIKNFGVAWNQSNNNTYIACTMIFPIV
jgi:hypothetical protein